MKKSALLTETISPTSVRNALAHTFVYNGSYSARCISVLSYSQQIQRFLDRSAIGPVKDNRQGDTTPSYKLDCIYEHYFVVAPKCGTAVY